MKLATKSLLSALTAAIVNAAPGISQVVSQRKARRYERILEKYDRKGELRAAVLGITSVDFRAQERKRSLAEIVKVHGFSDEKAFYRAVIAKIHDELHARGWTWRRIYRFEAMQLQRMM